MRSFDLFDTVIARWYRVPHSIFDEIEVLGNPSFKTFRIQAESISDGTFVGIYRMYQKLTGISDSEMYRLQSLEFSLECSRTFPIMENVRQLEADSVIISDTYFNKEELTGILQSNCIYNYDKIICGNGIKYYGTVWKDIKPESHLDDNIDVCKVAMDNHINARVYWGGFFSKPETVLAENGYYNIACFARMLRLLNPYADDERKQTWNDQADVNIPFLLLLSNYLYKLSKEEGFSTLLFTERDCINLYDLFSSRFVDIPAYRFSTCRNLYIHPTNEFIKYVKKMYNIDTLIVDLQGTGNTTFDFIMKHFGLVANYFTAVWCDLSKKHDVYYIGHQEDGFSDKIESLNYAPLGRLQNVVGNVAIREPRIESEFVDIQNAVVGMAYEYIHSGFKLEITPPAKSLLKYFLRYMEGYCVTSDELHARI